MPIGVLNKTALADLLDRSPAVLITTNKVNITIDDDASAIDMPIGREYFEMQGSCRPSADRSVAELISELKVGGGPIPDAGVVLERGKVYLVRLAWERIKLLPSLCARATAKSSIGRLDALVRLVTGGQSEFDKVSLGGEGDLFLEVAPLTFALLIKPGVSLSQIRFIRGDERECTPTWQGLAAEEEAVLFHPRTKGAPLNTSEGDPSGILLSLDLTADQETGFAGFVAKKSIQEAIDPTRRKDDRYEPREFWEPIPAPASKWVKIEKDRFYIFRSVERFCVPSHLAVDCQAYSEGLGDIRIHYAGFAHPYFGKLREDGKTGTPLIFEVRGHSVDTFLRDGDALAKVYFRRMATSANRPQTMPKYGDQELTLSACFKPWPSGAT